MMQLPDIERGIPIPPASRQVQTEKTLAFLTMEVGDSRFFVAETRPERDRWQSRASAVGKGHGMKFSSRVVMKGGVKGLRVWRVS